MSGQIFHCLGHVYDASKSHIPISHIGNRFNFICRSIETDNPFVDDEHSAEQPLFANVKKTPTDSNQPDALVIIADKLSLFSLIGN